MSVHHSIKRMGYVLAYDNVCRTFTLMIPLAKNHFIVIVCSSLHFLVRELRHLCFH